MKKILIETQKLLEKSYSIKNESKISYEEGSPLNYVDDFKKMWLLHMEYINSIQTFQGQVMTERIFYDSLTKFSEKHEDVKLFVSKDDTRFIGFLQAGLLTRNSFGFISDLHVSSEYRDMGIGSRLLENCLSWFNRKNIKNIQLVVAGGNEKVLPFYEKYGFKKFLYTLKKE